MIAATFSASGLLAVIGLGLLAGTLIGCIGIGGVVLVPALAYLGGVPFPVAIAAAMMGYMLTGLVGTIVYARNASIRWPMALYLMGGAMPAALLGAWTSNRAPTALLETAIALLTLSSGAHAVWSRGSSDAGDRSLSPLPLSLIGAGTGFASGPVELTTCLTHQARIAGGLAGCDPDTAATVDVGADGILDAGYAVRRVITVIGTDYDCAAVDGGCSLVAAPPGSPDLGPAAALRFASGLAPVDAEPPPEG